MEFAAAYFEGEEREGFYVKPLMKKVWAAQLEVLGEVDRICKRHGIKYFAEWGTLLGAVRHKGYIPWDDDLDIGMLRVDYEKFLYYARKEVPAEYVVVDITDERYDELMARVMNRDRIYLPDKAFLEKYHGSPFCVGVDINCLDNIPKNKEDEELLLIWLYMANKLSHEWDSQEVSPEDKMEWLRMIEEQTGCHFNLKLPMKKQLLQLSDKISAMYHDAEADEVTLMCMMTDNRKYRLPKSCYERVVEVPFENTIIPIPVGYDQVLRLRYGDNYMTPIQDYDGGSLDHEYPFFKSQINALKSVYARAGMEMPEYFDWKE